MNKKPARKIKLSLETLRVLTRDQMTEIAGGGTTGEPTATLTIGTSPFPSHGRCSLPI